LNGEVGGPVVVHQLRALLNSLLLQPCPSKTIRNDCFGDFEGFDLEDCDEWYHFVSGEGAIDAIQEIVWSAYHERTRLTVGFNTESRRILGIMLECALRR
jgi:hypothetical protein